MQFFYTDPQTELERLFGGYHHVNAIGPIAPGDDKKFEVFLNSSTPPPRTTIYIDSLGGNVDAAINIGRLIRESWFATSIGQYRLKPKTDFPLVEREFISGKCMSAATLAYLGGRLRYFDNDSEFGVHQFSFKDPSPDDLPLSQRLSAKIAKYISEIGVGPEFLELTASTPGDEINLLSERKLRSLNVITGGQTEARWSTESKRNMIYVKGERDSIYGHHKVMLTYAKETGFMFWAVIEAQGREEELTKFGLVEIVLNGEETRIDVSSICERGVFGNYVNILTKLDEDQARLVANSDSFGVQVRFSSEAEMFLGISAVSTEGGREALTTLFNTCSS